MKIKLLRVAAAVAIVFLWIKDSNAGRFSFVPREPENRWTVYCLPASEAPLEHYTPLGDMTLHQLTEFPTQAVFVSWPVDTRWARLATDYFRLRLMFPPEFLYSPESRQLSTVEKELTQKF